MTEKKVARTPEPDRERGSQVHMNVRIERDGAVAVITLDRPEVRNAIDGPTAAQLAAAVREFEADDSARAAVLYGSGGNFCAGLDLKALASEPERAVRYDDEGDAPTGIARMTQLSKPLIAAVEGYAVAAGLELALMCDLRVASEESVFGMFNRRWGVPLTDGGTFRLPRIVGQSRALDIAPGKALEAALDLAEQLARFPQRGLRADRRAALEQWSLDEQEALRNEWAHALAALEHGDIQTGAARFASGLGRHGDFGSI